MFAFLAIFFLSLSSIAFGESAQSVAVPSFLDMLLQGETFAKITGVAVAVQFILYGLAEGLTRLAVLTENKWDNRAAVFLSQAVWLLGVVLGKFGYSSPRLVIEEKAKALIDKDKTGGKS